ncbi:unnamed protein product [Mytilus coruscus]|uniref:RXRA n=1 Tax=Mytilus coruscus TaxID=42192 RepID=A0A6J8A0L9_MYTCO|nr:unnamed protein product [Mytilus coruscus]
MFSDEQSVAQDLYHTDMSSSTMGNSQMSTSIIVQPSQLSATKMEQLSTTDMGDSPDNPGTLYIGDQMMGQGQQISPPPQVSTTVDLHSSDSGHSSQFQEPIAPCLVCGDKGSGYHYSVFSCEGCKGFFKRTVQKFLSYTCKGSGNCNVSKFTRNNCQACRFQKCLEAGMKKEAVRDDRSPGGKNRNKRQRLEDIPGLINPDGTINIIPESIEPEEDNLIVGLVQAKPDLTPKFESGNLDSEYIDINQIMQHGYAELKFIIDWAKKVPGFKALCIDDQMALLKAAFMELNVLRLSYRSMETSNCIKFAEGLIVPTELAQGVGFGKELVNATTEFAARLKEIDIDLTEFCCLNAIVLTYPDAAGLKDKPKILAMQGKILESLRRYTATQYPNDPRRYSKILLRLPSLRSVSAKAAERFLSLSLDGSLQLNSLVLDMIT